LLLRDVQWLAHGHYLLKSKDKPMEVFEVGTVGHAALQATGDSEKARRVVSHQEESVKPATKPRSLGKMRLCEICKEPAARRVTSGSGGLTAHYYCYIHAVEKGLLEFPLNLLERTAAETGYSVNALIFVLESLTRAGCVKDAGTADGAESAIAAPKTALELCVSVSGAAVEHFQQQAGLVLNHWKLRRGKDLSAVLSGLIRSDVLTIAGEGDEKLLQELSMVDGPLAVEA
jgi:uncharacterized repeat protein (TIGR04138 family)